MSMIFLWSDSIPLELKVVYSEDEEHDVVTGGW